jgi:hypothetical protein
MITWGGGARKARTEGKKGNKKRHWKGSEFGKEVGSELGR